MTEKAFSMLWFSMALVSMNIILFLDANSSPCSSSSLNFYISAIGTVWGRFYCPPSGIPCPRCHSFWALSAISPDSKRKKPWWCRRQAGPQPLPCSRHWPWIGIAPARQCPRSEPWLTPHRRQPPWWQIRPQLWSCSPSWTSFWWTGIWYWICLLLSHLPTLSSTASATLPSCGSSIIFNYTRVKIRGWNHSFGQFMEDRKSNAETHAIEQDRSFPEEEQRADSPQQQPLPRQCSRPQHEPIELQISI